MDRLGRNMIDCVCVIKTRTFCEMRMSLYGSCVAEMTMGQWVTGHGSKSVTHCHLCCVVISRSSRCLVQIRCGSICSDAVRCGPMCSFKLANISRIYKEYKTVPFSVRSVHGRETKHCYCYYYRSDIFKIIIILL